jgi:hypothetical protein
MQALQSITSELGTEMKQAQVVNQDGNALPSCRIAVIGVVFKKSAEIKRIVHEMENDTIDCIIARLVSFHGDQDVRKLLLHFESRVKAVIKETYKDTESNHYQKPEYSGKHLFPSMRDLRTFLTFKSSRLIPLTESI